MIEDKFLSGWPSAFYVFGKINIIYDYRKFVLSLYNSAGVISCIWFIGWAFFGFNSPNEHPRISAAEREFLNREIVSRPNKVY